MTYEWLEDETARERAQERNDRAYEQAIAASMYCAREDRKPVPFAFAMAQGRMLAKMYYPHLFGE